MCKPVKVLGTIKRLGTIVRFCAIETIGIIDRLGTIVRLHTKGGEPFLQEMTFSFKHRIEQKLMLYFLFFI